MTIDGLEVKDWSNPDCIMFRVGESMEPGDVVYLAENGLIYKCRAEKPKDKLFNTSTYKRTTYSFRKD